MPYLSLLFFCWNIGTLEQDLAKSLITLNKLCSSKTHFLEHCSAVFRLGT